MNTLKIACLTGAMVQVQRELGEYGLCHDVNAFWTQFIRWYNRVGLSLRKHTKNKDGIVKKEDSMDSASRQLYQKMLDWLKTM